MNVILFFIDLSVIIYLMILIVLYFMYRHEITGVITKVGSDVSGFKEGERVGVGCLAASCLDCEFCKTDQENYCEKLQFVYNGIFWDGSITYGGYSQMLVVDYRYFSMNTVLL